MLDGKAREMGLGAYPDISLAEARVLASDARKLKTRGEDPIESREALRSQQRAEAARSVTFRHCSKAYIAARADGWKNRKTKGQWEAALEAYAMPVIGDLPVQAIDVALVNRVLEPIWSSKTETASRVRGRVEAILDWAKVRGYRQGDNPARWKGHLENLFPRRSKVQKIEHHAALPYGEIGAFMKRLQAYDGTGALALQFTILTASRTGEAIGAQWDEIDLDAGVWTIPGTRMKAGREHRVPLSKAALNILRVRHKSRNKSPFVFEGSKRGRPISNMAMLQTLRRLGRDDLTVHGFRSAFRDWAEECTAYTGAVAEAALAHVVGDKVEAAYRRGDLFEKRRKLMDAWAQHCNAPATSAQVVSIRRAPR
jgi:integrase